MEIVDAQVHLFRSQAETGTWDEESRTYVQNANVTSAARGSFSADELLEEMKKAGVDRAVLVPPVFAGNDNSPALEAARAHPGAFAVMGRIAVDEPDGADRLRGWLDEPGMRGVRLTFFYERHARWLTDGTADWIWPILAECAIPVAVFAPGQSPRLGEIAKANPALHLTIDHFGIPLDLRDEAIRPYVDELVALHTLENVCVKASALPGYVTGPYPFSVLHREIERVVEAFGPKRVFFGSEMTRLPQPYVECVKLFTEALEFLSDEDLEWIMGRAIRDWLSWSPM